MTDLLADTLSNPAVGAIGSALLLAVLALWLAAAWWAYADAGRRTESTLAGFVAAGWIILSTPLLLPLALAAYALVRPQVAAADSRTRALAAELGRTPTRPACGTCGELVDEAWLRCPTCTTWLAAPCAHCGGWSDAALEICPWCGSESRDRPYVQAFGAGEPDLDVSAADTALSDVPVEAARGRRRRPAWRTTIPAVPRGQRREGHRVPIAPGVLRGTSRVPS